MYYGKSMILFQYPLLLHCYRLKQLLDTTTHVVVDFRNCKKSCLALVLRTWLSEAKTTWHCQYPKGQETEAVEEEYVRANIAPEKDWPKYKVKILQEACE